MNNVIAHVLVHYVCMADGKHVLQPPNSTQGALCSLNNVIAHEHVVQEKAWHYRLQCIVGDGFV